MDLKIFIVNQGKLEMLKNPVFTTGDAYIIVDEKGEKVYIWLGSKCSVDEKGAAAVEARRIDEGQVFHGGAQIITYDEGDEPPEFLKKLNGLKIIDKNLSKSMLKDVSTGEFADQADHVNALYRVSSEEFDGMDAIKFVQVPFKKESLDGEDAFLADLGVDLWVWQGKDCNVREKVKVMQFAREFDAIRSGAQRPKIYEDGVDDAEFLGIFEGRLPKQDRSTVDLHPEVFENKEEPVHEKFEPSSQTKPEMEETSYKSPEIPSSIDSDGMLVQRGSGRLKCPKCGNDNPSMIREVDDRTRLLYDYPPIYAKKYICGKCGAEFRHITD
ncbi:MAG: hypothetical protein ACTSWL_09120 [Promethearchaeota archaeon]